MIPTVTCYQAQRSTYQAGDGQVEEAFPGECYSQIIKIIIIIIIAFALRAPTFSWRPFGLTGSWLITLISCYSFYFGYSCYFCYLSATIVATLVYSALNSKLQNWLEAG